MSMTAEFPDIEPAAPRLTRSEPDHDDVTRALPHALGPEKSVLSCMLQYPDTMIGAAVEHGLTAGHFYLPSHSLLFGIVTGLTEANKEVELVSLAQHLIDIGKLDRIGGPAALSDLYTYAPSPGIFDHHVRMVREKHILRELIRNSNETISAAYDAPEEVAELLDDTEARFLAIRNTADTGREVSIKERVRLAIDEIARAIDGGDAGDGISTGYGGLDDLRCNLKPGELFIIAARPSMGKTSLMMNIVERVCVDGRRPSQVFSLEMTAHQLTHRMICARARFSIGKLTKGGKADRGELQRIRSASTDIAASPLHINDESGLTISRLRAIARRKHRECKTELIAIDYLQLMRSTSKQARDSREREVAEISAGLKGLAKELSIPIILLAQLNRGPENRTGKNLGRPRLADLRESGAIEQDADMVGLLYRPEYYDHDEQAGPTGSAELVLAKNRNGPTGSAHLTFIAEQMRFENGKPVTENHQPQTGNRFNGYE